MLHQIFVSQQVMGKAIISNNHGIYEFPLTLLNDLVTKLPIFRTLEKSGKSQHLQKL